MIKHATRHECASVTKIMNKCFEKQIMRLKKIIKKLKRMIEKTKNIIKKTFEQK